MTSQIRVDIVADASKFESAIKSADRAAGKFDQTTKDMGDSLEKSQRQARGAADLFDGFGTLLGFNVEAPMRFARGVADLADGMGTVLVPALQTAIANIKAYNATLSASQKFAVGAAVGATIAAGAFLSVAASTEKGQDAIGQFTDLLNRRVNRELGVLGKGLGWIDGHIGGVGAKFLKFAGIMDRVSDSVRASGERLEVFKQQALDAAEAIRIANSLGGTVEDPDGAFASAAAVESATNNRGEGIASPFREAAKRIKSGVTEMHKAATDAFARLQPKLQDAADKFKAALALKDSVNGNFKLDFSTDIGHSVEEGLRAQVDRFKEFTRKIAWLRRSGLNEGLVRQFADAGPASLEQMDRINSGNLGEINRLAKQAGLTGDAFSSAEAMRRTGTDPNKPVKVTLDVKGGQKELVDLIKKWVRTEGGGDVRVAFK